MWWCGSAMGSICRCTQTQTDVYIHYVYRSIISMFTGVQRLSFVIYQENKTSMKMPKKKKKKSSEPASNCTHSAYCSLFSPD